MDTHLSIEIKFLIELFEVYCLRPGWRSRGWQTMYHLRFVLDGIRSLSPLVVLKCVFIFKSNSKSEKLVVFFWCRQDQKGTGGTEIYVFNGLEK